MTARAFNLEPHQLTVRDVHHNSILQPRRAWPGASCDATTNRLAGLFHANITQHQSGVNTEIEGSGPS